MPNTAKHKPVSKATRSVCEVCDCAVRARDQRGGVPFVEVAVSAAQQHHMAPGCNGGAMHFTPTQHAPVGSLGLAITDLHTKFSGQTGFVTTTTWRKPAVVVL